MRQAFVDANVFAYALGAAHPQRASCRRLLAAAQAGLLRLHASTEAIQELVHHRMRVSDRAVAVTQARDVAELCVLHPVDAGTVARALDLLESTTLRGRDAVHAATALIAGFDTIVSTDRDFDGLPGLARREPADLDIA